MKPPEADYALEVLLAFLPGNMPPKALVWHCTLRRTYPKANKEARIQAEPHCCRE